MLIVPAESKWLGLPVTVAQTVAVSEVFSLNGFDRATAILTVEQIYGGATSADRTVSFGTETSLDGVNWAVQGPSGGTQDVTSSGSPPVKSTADVNGAFVRFRLTFAVTVAGATAGVLFDLHVNLDKK